MEGRRYGCNFDPADDRDKLLKDEVKIMRSSRLPNKTSDLQPYTPKACDQGSIGACTGAATTRAIKQLSNYHPVMEWPYMPSALDVYAKVRKYMGIPLTEDTGACIRDVFKVLNTEGVCPEDAAPEISWPFITSGDHWTKEPPLACMQEALKYRIVKYMRVSNSMQAIKTALVANMPLVIGVMVHESFESGKVTDTGVIPMPGRHDSKMGGHCMFIDGYGNYKGDYAEGMNSWGTRWGKDGRFFIPFKYLCDPELTSDIWAIQLLSS